MGRAQAKPSEKQVHALASSAESLAKPRAQADVETAGWVRVQVATARPMERAGWVRVVCAMHTIATIVATEAGRALPEVQAEVKRRADEAAATQARLNAEWEEHERKADEASARERAEADARLAAAGRQHRKVINREYRPRKPAPVTELQADAYLNDTATVFLDAMDGKSEPSAKRAVEAAYAMLMPIYDRMARVWTAAEVARLGFPEVGEMLRAMPPLTTVSAVLEFHGERDRLTKEVYRLAEETEDHYLAMSGSSALDTAFIGSTFLKERTAWNANCLARKLGEIARNLSQEDDARRTLTMAMLSAAAPLETP